MAAAAYVAAAGALIGIFGSIAESNAQRKRVEFEAKIQQRNAESQALLLERDAESARLDARDEAELLAFDVQTARTVFERQLGTTIASIGASGTEFSGSNLVVAIDQAREAELGIEVLTFASERRQEQLIDEANLLEFQAEQARESGVFARRVARATSRGIKRALPLTIAGGAIGGAGSVLGAGGFGGGSRGGGGSRR